MAVHRRSAAPPLLAVAVAACVPEGPATNPDAGAAPSPLQPISTARASAEPNGEREDPPILEPFEDSFDRAALGPDWLALSPAWKIHEGRMCVRGAKNKGAWLRRVLPDRARIELEATADSPDGDLKLELWGDGKSGATGTSYTNATSYVLILGGWKNTKHVLARLDEHGADRLDLDVDPTADDERLRPVEPGQPYRFSIERSDGKTLVVSINGQTLFRWSDPAPLAGDGHDHLGLNDWDAPVCFDNLRIIPL
jgi:hypothetical protein